MSDVPDVITRYYAAAERGDIHAVMGCFSPDAHVLDEDHHYWGAEEVRRWRESVATRFTYTSEITGAERTADGEHLVSTHLEGDFPGGAVDLVQRFTLTDGLITQLLI